MYSICSSVSSFKLVTEDNDLLKLPESISVGELLKELL
jgi:hypothetical protein